MSIFHDFYQVPVSHNFQRFQYIYFYIHISGILPSSWRRFTVPAGLTVIQWITDFSERVKQLQNIATASQQGGAAALKVILSLKEQFHYE